MGCSFKNAEASLTPLQVMHGVEYKNGFPSSFYTIMIDLDSLQNVELFRRIYDYRKVRKIDKTIQLFKDDYNFLILTIDDKKINSFSQFVNFLMKRDEKKEYIVFTKQQCFIVLSTEFPVKIISIKEPVKIKRE